MDDDIWTDVKPEQTFEVWTGSKIAVFSDDNSNIQIVTDYDGVKSQVFMYKDDAMQFLALFSSALQAAEETHEQNRVEYLEYLECQALEDKEKVAIAEADLSPNMWMAST
jgi:hypothetical protein